MKEILRTACRSTVAVLAVVAIFYAVFVHRYARNFNGNMSGFACIGDRFPAPGIVTAKTFVLPNCTGYDGQFFFFAAHDPLMLGDVRRYMDTPAYRYQRIMYPLLVSALACGRPSAIPDMLVLVNVLMVLVGTYFVTRMLREQGMSPWYGLAYGLLSGLIIATARDLADGVAAGFMVGGMYFYTHRRYLPAAVFLAATLLSRELGLVAVMCLAADAVLFKRSWPGLFRALGSGRGFSLPEDFRKNWGGLWASVAAVVPFAMWQVYVRWVCGAWSWSGGTANFGKAFAGMLRYSRRLFHNPGAHSEKVYAAVFLAVTVIGALLAIREIVRRRNEFTVPFLAFSILPFVLSRHVWVEPWSYGRVMLPMQVFLVLTFINTRDKVYLVPVAGYGVLFVATLKWLNVL